MSVKRMCLFLCLLLLPGLSFFSVQAAAPSSQDRQEYIVAKGDTLYSIARQYHLKTDQLADFNDLNPKAILSIGQQLWIPQDPSRQVVITKGDTLWQIARDHGVRLSELVSYNKISEPGKLKIGQVINIPVSGDEAVAVPAVAGGGGQRVGAASRSAANTGFIWPLKGIITSAFGQRKNRYHHGLDIAAKSGTTIGAAKAGKVIHAGWRNNVYGRCVIIDHGNNQKTLYAHASKVLVKNGAQVRAGQAIAEVGATGNTTGAHLHFELHIDDKVVDPQKYLR
ncbi:MAG: M23 family metallopeptidase [Clostridiales bacterium]|nr:M23 family metallopeptidase [Clostridiales bacterium]